MEETKNWTPSEILDLPLEVNDSGADTVRGYLAALLTALWHEGEGFSGKRPFGNSGWEYDLYTPLVRAGVVRGSLDEYGYVNDVDRQAASIAIDEAIKTLG